jgi:hypothetical protein
VGILIFAFGLIIYFFSCIYIAKVNVAVRNKIKGKVALEYIAWLVFIILYIPYSFFFPAWLSEYLMVWERTPNLTATMLGLGMVVSVLAMFKGGRINAT